jgi:hypothetical protein
MVTMLKAPTTMDISQGENTSSKRRIQINKVFIQLSIDEEIQSGRPRH